MGSALVIRVAAAVLFAAILGVIIYRRKNA